MTRRLSIAISPLALSRSLSGSSLREALEKLSPRTAVHHEIATWRHRADPGNGSRLAGAVTLAAFAKRIALTAALTLAARESWSAAAMCDYVD